MHLVATKYPSRAQRRQHRFGVFVTARDNEHCYKLPHFSQRSLDSLIRGLLVLEYKAHCRHIAKLTRFSYEGRRICCTTGTYDHHYHVGGFNFLD